MQITQDILVVSLLSILATGLIYMLGAYTDIHPIFIIFAVQLVSIPLGIFIDRKERLRAKDGKFV